MIRLIKTGVALLVLFIVGWIGLSLFPKKAVVPQPTLTVAATIFPIYDLVRFIAGEHANVILLLDTGEALEKIDHIYNRGDFSSLQAIFAVGRDFDTKNIPEHLKSKLVSVDQDIALLKNADGSVNPFYWLSVKQAPLIASTITLRLAELDPANAASYAQRLSLLKPQLAALDTHITELLRQLPTKKMAVYGYDWSYFAQDYGLDIVYESAAAQLAVVALAQTASQEGLRAIFSDISLSPAPLLSFIDRPGFSILNLDALGGVEDRQSYVALMAYNARTIFDGLNEAAGQVP